MFDKNSSYNFKADYFFPWLLLCTLISIITLTCWQVEDLKSVASWKLVQSWSTINYLGVGLTLWTFLLLSWRIWFACRYRSYAPLFDSALPAITIVIPAYNEGRQILHTVRSVMNSRYPKKKMQVICVDDGSQDDTWEWMQTVRQEFSRSVRLIRQPFNRGKRHALMAGFAEAIGKIYVTIDSDSEVLPDTLRHLVSPLASDPRVGAVAGNVRVLNLSEGAIPKMMEVSFTCGFDFIRSGQSVYGGVFCTPGALSAYRADVITPYLPNWINQTFMGRHAAIGEDRALTNLVLSCGFRVVYQREAVVLTKVPITFTGLRKMLLRWARSNVRENLVMLSFMIGRFRPADGGSGWIRLFSTTQFIRMTLGEAFKFAVMAQLMLAPVHTLFTLAVACIISASLPALVYQKRYGGWFGWHWAIPYAFYWLFCLCWISFWGLLTAFRSGWLTRGLIDVAPPSKRPTARPTANTSRIFSKAA
ncbi:MAG: glycosyltransferase [Desulfobacterales bacterium]|jgi:hyaluronan synthase